MLPDMFYDKLWPLYCVAHTHTDTLCVYACVCVQWLLPLLIIYLILPRTHLTHSQKPESAAISTCLKVSAKQCYCFCFLLKQANNDIPVSVKNLLSTAPFVCTSSFFLSHSLYLSFFISLFSIIALPWRYPGVIFSAPFDFNWFAKVEPLCEPIENVRLPRSLGPWAAPFPPCRLGARNRAGKRTCSLG